MGGRSHGARVDIQAVIAMGKKKAAFVTVDILLSVIVKNRYTVTARQNVERRILKTGTFCAGKSVEESTAIGLVDDARLADPCPPITNTNIE